MDSSRQLQAAYTAAVQHATGWPVYDHPPENAPLPYVVSAVENVSPWGGKDSSGQIHEISFTCYPRSDDARGRQLAQTKLAAIIQALDDVELPLEGLPDPARGFFISQGHMEDMAGNRDLGTAFFRFFTQ